nr:PREDICTED: uncharacterized protein LOC105663896 isoform X2 [Megachile rotundata]
MWCFSHTRFIQKLNHQTSDLFCKDQANHSQILRFCAAMVCVVVILARRSSKYCTNVRDAGLVANSEG